jgi:outer membrane murein-binding lipoprotein Lpp
VLGAVALGGVGLGGVGRQVAGAAPPESPAGRIARLRAKAARVQAAIERMNARVERLVEDYNEVRSGFASLGSGQPVQLSPRVRVGLADSR